VTVSDPALGQVVGTNLHSNTIPGENANVVHAHLAGNMSHHLVAILELDTKHCVGQGVDDLALNLNLFFLSQKSASLSVTISQYFCAMSSDGNSVLKVSGRLAVDGQYRPAVCEGHHILGPKIAHRLDGQDDPLA